VFGQVYFAVKPESIRMKIQHRLAIAWGLLIAVSLLRDFFPGLPALVPLAGFLVFRVAFVPLASPKLKTRSIQFFLGSILLFALGAGISSVWALHSGWMQFPLAGVALSSCLCGLAFVGTLLYSDAVLVWRQERQEPAPWEPKA
jgi:hypothetical protein